MNAEKRSAFTVAMGAVLLVATLAAVSPLGLAQHGARIAVFHLEAADTAASGGGADVYIQRNAGWDVNIDIYNRSGETINDVEIVLEGDVDFGDSFYPNTPRISTTADGNTQLHWATGEIPDGARVHVGFDHSGGHVTIVGIWWPRSHRSRGKKGRTPRSCYATRGLSQSSSATSAIQPSLPPFSSSICQPSDCRRWRSSCLRLHWNPIPWAQERRSIRESAWGLSRLQPHRSGGWHSSPLSRPWDTSCCGFGDRRQARSDDPHWKRAPPPSAAEVLSMGYYARPP